MNKVLRGGIIGSLITLAAAIGGSEIYKHYTSPEYKQARVAEQRARELDEKLGFVFSNEPWNEGRTYKLSNGADIQIKLLYMDRTARLELIAGGTVLQSEPWWHNGDDNWFSHLRSLGSVRIIDSPDGVITTLGKGKIPNYAEWQKKI